MPIALDTTEAVDVWLDSDAKKEPRPTFVFRHLSYKQFREVERMRDEADVTEKQDVHAAHEKRMEAIRLALVGWKNMGLDYDPNDLSFLTRFEAFELVWKYPGALNLSEMEKNARSSPSQSDTEPSTASPPLQSPS